MRSHDGILKSKSKEISDNCFKMSPNQMHDDKKRHEVKTDAIANKRSCYLYTLKAYKMLSQDRTK